MTQPYESELTVAISAVRTAARLCQAVAGQITPHVLEKKDRSPVTVADFGSQALVCKALAEPFPDDPMIAEEDSHALREPDHVDLLGRVIEHVSAITGPIEADTVCQWIDRGNRSDYGDRFWTLDPIDGTKGFLRREQYAIALALIEKGEIVVAALGCPNLPLDPARDEPTGALFTAVKGQGAQTRSLFTEDEPTSISVTDTGETSEARFCESVESAHSAHGDAEKIAELLNITAEPFRIDSQCKYAAVARGQADIYLRLPTGKDYVEKIWDHAAGALVVTEAGGTVTDVAGNPLDFTHGARLETNRGAIVTNGTLQEAVIHAVRQIGVK